MFLDVTNGTKLLEIPIRGSVDGRVIAANADGTVYIYGGDDTFLYKISTATAIITHINVTGAGDPRTRFSPAIAGYLDGFFMQGGFVSATNTSLYSDLWQYTGGVFKSLPCNLTAANHSAVVSPLSATIYFTGSRAAQFPLYEYDVTNMNGHSLVNDTNFPPREGALPTIVANRVFLYGGMPLQGEMKPLTELWQLVNEQYCITQPDCETCVGIYGCTWCGTPVVSGSNCVAGNETIAFISRTCLATGTSKTVEYCPEQFPSWAIALIVIGGVIFVGGVVFGIMKLRSGKPGYDPVV